MKPCAYAAPFALLLTATAFAQATTVVVAGRNDRAIQAAIDSLPPAGGTVLMPVGIYDIRYPISLRGKCIQLTGQGRPVWPKRGTPTGTVLYAAFTSDSAASWPMIDMTGAKYCVLDNFGVYASPNMRYPPAVGLLLARTAYTESSSGHTFQRLKFYGSFRVACVYNIGSEVNRWYNCSFFQFSDGGAAYLTSSWNGHGVESPHGVIAGTGTIGAGAAQSNVEQTFFGCAFGLAVKDMRNSSCIVIEPRTQHYRFYACTGSVKSTDYGNPAKGGHSVFRLGVSGIPRRYSAVENAVRNIHIVDWYGEEMAAKHFIDIQSPTYGLRVRDSRIRSRENAVQIGADLTDSRIEANTFQTFAEYAWENEPDVRAIIYGDSGVRISNSVISLREDGNEIGHHPTRKWPNTGYAGAAELVATDLVRKGESHFPLLRLESIERRVAELEAALRAKEGP